MLISPHRLLAWLWRYRWPTALVVLPFAYVAAVTLPHPFGLGLQHGNDFQGHRIWWTDLATWYLKQGQVPVWSPSLDFGTLFFGQRGHAFFYPGGWWTHVFHAPMIPAWQTWAHYLQICLHMGLAMLGVYRLLRVRGGVAEPAAFIGSALLLLNQRFHDSVRYPCAIETMAWIPWILLLAIRVFENTAADAAERRRRGNDALKLALVTAMSWLAGYGQLTYIAALLVAIVTLTAGKSVRAVLLAAAAAAGGSLLAAGTLLPTAWMASLAPHRSGDNFGFATQYPRLGSYLEMFSRPFHEDVHASLFFPPVFLGLIAMGLYTAWKRPHRRLSAGLLLAALVILDLARGDEGWLCRVAYDHLPMYKAFRVQGRNNWITLLALCWFAGLGADRLLTGSARERRIGTALLVMIVVGVALHHLTHTPASREGMTPASTSEMSASLLTYSFWMLLAGTTLPLLVALPARTRMLLPGAMVAMIWSLVFFYGRYSTWYRPPPSKEVHPNFPAGLLAPFRRGAGLISNSLVEDDALAPLLELQAGLTGTPERRFPATRFAFFPAEGGTNAVVRLDLMSFGANHLRATVNTSEPGCLVYFNTMFPGWRGSPAPKPAQAPLQRFMCFDLPAGFTELRIEFFPRAVIACSLLTLTGLSTLATMLAFRAGHRRGAATLAGIGLVVTTAFLTGTFSRRSLSERQLFGIDGSTRDPDGRVPVVPQWPRAGPDPASAQAGDVPVKPL